MGLQGEHRKKKGRKFISKQIMAEASQVWSEYGHPDIWKKNHRLVLDLNRPKTSKKVETIIKCLPSMKNLESVKFTATF